MNIGGVTTQMAAKASTTQIGTAVLAKALDSKEIMGDGIVRMLDSAAMERSVNPTVGANFDERV